MTNYSNAKKNFNLQLKSFNPQGTVATRKVWLPPTKYGCHPQSRLPSAKCGCHPQSITCHPQSITCHPQSITCHPQSVICHPQSILARL